MKIIIAQKHKAEGGALDSIKSTLIKKWTKSDYYHTEIIINNRWISSIPGKGVRVKPLKKEVDKSFDYFEINVEGHSEEDLRILENFILFVDGADYDWIGIFFTQIINLDTDSKNRWFCSELVTKILQIILVEESIYIRPSRTSPGGLQKAIQNRVRKIEVDSWLL